MDIQIKNLGNMYSFNYKILDYCDDDEIDWEHCGVNYRPFTSSLCYFDIVNSNQWKGFSFLVVYLGKNKCLFVNMESSQSCFFDPSSTLEDIYSDITEAVDDDDELALLLSSIIMTQFFPDKNQFFPDKNQDSVSFPVLNNNSFILKA